MIPAAALAPTSAKPFHLLPVPLPALPGWGERVAEWARR
jgi:hypothetical protein